MAALLDNVRFTPTAGGTTDWTYFSAVTGYQSPAAAGVVNGTKYKYFAISSDSTQWEIGEGAYNTSTGVLPRTTVLYNSSGTGTASGQSGTGSKINFSAAPAVAIVGLAEDIALAPNQRTRTVLTSGSGTYTLPTGCKALQVRMVGGGGGGGGSGAGTTMGTGGTGGNTTFGTSFLTANGGSGGGDRVYGAGGTASIGAGASGLALSGADGSGGQATTSANPGPVSGGDGAGTPFAGGGAGGAGINPTVVGNGVANSGAGGGGAGVGGVVNLDTGGGGGAGGYIDALIVNPATSYAYAIGSGGAGGTAGTGTSAHAGGSGGSGVIIIDEHY